MYVFVKEENLKDFKNNKTSPDTQILLLFTISLGTKTDKENIKKLKEKLQNYKNYKKAILIKIEKITNSIISNINNISQSFDLIIGQGGLNSINRFFVEQTKIDLLLDPHTSEFEQKFDFIHHFNSGMNHILFNLMKEKEMCILISLTKYIGNKSLFYKDIGRINQNLMLARKSKIKTIFANFYETDNKLRSQKEINQLLKIFDISTKQIKESENFFNNHFNNKDKYQEIKVLSK